MPFTSITFTPLIPLWLFILLASLAIAVSGISLVYSNKWTTLCRLGAFTVILLWLANPQQTHKTWRTLPPTALILVDNSPSMHFGERTALAQKALHFLENNHPPHLILHTVVVNDNGHEGTRLFNALQQASADIPPGHLAGVIMITDGENNDTPLSVTQQIPPQIIASNRYGQPFFLPLYVLLTASHEEIDRRLSVLQAPPYALVGKTAFIRIRVEDQGSLQKETPVTLTLRLNEAEPLTFPIHTGQSQEIHLPITHPGQNFIALSVSPLQGEVSTQNNQVIIPITGIRDRLRVLLISGAPNQEERSLRRFLKADPAVDLVHCTILRPPEKDDGTPLSDLALIAFPARELFEQKINQFNLIILDGFQNQFLFPESYFENIAQFVRNGGGLLLIAGPEFAGSNSLQNTPLNEILPAHVLENKHMIVNRPFRPQLTAIGQKHPVTSLLPESFSFSSLSHKNTPVPLWGPWYRALQPNHVHGEVLMTGPKDTPLLILDRVGKGRVAMLLSDQIWLWSRGEGGGGPYAELLRRVAHWLMKEPALEEERLSARITHNTLFITRHTLTPTASSFVTVTPPHEKAFRVALTQTPQDIQQGIQQASLPASAYGIWQISDGLHTIYTASTQNDTPEFFDLRATAEKLSPLVKKTGGGIFWLGSLKNFHAPRILEAHGSLLYGKNWLAFPQRETRILTQDTATPLLPAWLPLSLALALLCGAWWLERDT